MSKVVVNTESLTSLADVIRAKTNIQGSLIFPQDFVSAISSISTGGGGGSIQFAAGESTNYKQGTFTISGLAFMPDLVVFAVDTNIKNKSAVLYTAAINTSLPNNAQSLTDFSGSWSDYTWAKTSPVTAQFTGDGISLELISNPGNANINSIKWWAVGGLPHN